MSLSSLKNEVRKCSSAKKAKILMGFFKTGKGQYGEGDRFLGLTVPVQRKIAKRYKNLSLSNLKKLIDSKIHEYRLIALLILVYKYEKGEDKDRNKIYNFYLRNSKRVNSWDLVDLTADHIVGRHLLNRKKDILFKLSSSKNLWERRISIISTFRFIKEGKMNTTLDISELLIDDDHDLIHKAVGWMLREVGKRNLPIEKKFLNKHYKVMPRTMLRYAIERFPEALRQKYLKGEC